MELKRWRFCAYIQRYPRLPLCERIPRPHRRSLCLQPDTGEVRSLEEMEEDVGLKKRKSDCDAEKQTQAGQETGEKVKRKRGRPPAVKLPPNPPELTRTLSMLVDMVINYKDGWGPSVMQPRVCDAEKINKINVFYQAAFLSDSQ